MVYVITMLLLYKNSNIYEMAKRYLYLRKISGWLLRNILFALVVPKALKCFWFINARRLSESELSSASRNKKPALFVRAL